MTKVTAIEALRYLSRAVAEKGVDYIDETASGEGPLGGCAYFKTWEPNPEFDPAEDDPDWVDEFVFAEATNNMTPSCIVGHVIKYCWDGTDVISTIVRFHNEEGVSEFVNDSATSDLFTELALRVLTSAQTKQDRGSSWGEAFNRAVDYLGEYYREVAHGERDALDDTP